MVGKGEEEMLGGGKPLRTVNEGQEREDTGDDPKTKDAHAKVKKIRESEGITSSEPGSVISWRSVNVAGAPASAMYWLLSLLPALPALWRCWYRLPCRQARHGPSSASCPLRYMSDPVALKQLQRRKNRSG